MTADHWRIYCNLDSLASLELEAEVIQRLNQTLDSDQLTSSKVSMITVADHHPMAETLATIPESTPDDIKTELLTARCVISLVQPAPLQESPIQVSLTDFLLTKAHPSIFQWSDGSYERGEEVLRRMQHFEKEIHFPTSDFDPVSTYSARQQDDANSPMDKLVQALLGTDDAAENETDQSLAMDRDPHPFEAYLDLMEQAQEDFDVAMDLKASIRTLPEQASRLLQLVASKGIISKERAAAELRYQDEQMNRAMGQIKQMFRDLGLWHEAA